MVTTAKPAKRPKLKWRTRDSQNSQLYNLQLDVNDLQQEIAHLQQMRDILSAQRLNRMDDHDGSYVKVVREYHRVFQHGFRAVVSLASGQRVDTMEFLSRVMDERVSIGRFVGLDMMRDQWLRYSTALSDLDLRYISCEVLPQMDYVTPSGVVRSVAMVSSEASYESHFTLETIELMFPHLLQHHSVVAKLLGHKFRGIALFDFVFDTDSHRVIGYDFRLDLFAAFARLLHDLEDLCLLFEGAKISEEFLIGDLNVYPQTAADDSSIGDIDVSNNEELAPDSAVAPWDDPVVSKYASQRHTSEAEHEAKDLRSRKLELHSKLTNILDPADRVPLLTPPPASTRMASARVYPVAAAFPHQQMHYQQQQTHYQQLSAGFSSRPSYPWQLQLTSILSEDNQDEETKGEDATAHDAIGQDLWPAPRLPSVSYFPVAALGDNTIAGAARAPLLGKRSNPFAVPEFEAFLQ